MYESKTKGNKLLTRLCSTFTRSIMWIQADHAIDINFGTRTCLNLSNTRDKIRTPNPTKLQQIKLQNVLQICNYIIHKNRIFLYFENKVKNLNNITTVIIIIIIIIMIIMIRGRIKAIIKKMNKKKRYILFSFIWSLSWGEAVPLLPAILFWMSEWNFPCTDQYLITDLQN